MKKLLLVAMAITTLATSTLTTQVAAITNKDVIKQYIKESFTIEADYRIVLVKSEKLTSKMLKQRKRNGIIYVEKITSTSCGGKYGRTDDGGFVRYNKKTRIGRKVKSFLVYNPESKAVDDVIAVIDHKMIR